MSKYQYQYFDFRPATLALIETMNNIVTDYVSQGYRLTVRQLYYQLVARAIIPNTERSYKRVTGVVNDAKLAGMMDWEAIEDRTRSFIRRSHWTSAEEILRGAAHGFHMDMWEGQPERVFVIVEKEALAGVLERVCHDNDVPLLAARGYPSGTVLREFAVEDVQNAISDGQDVTIIHLGDHDPSGIDMTRDLRERIRLFGEHQSINLVRIALTMDQIDAESPPPNPAKSTDARFKGYRDKYGSDSWELDALQPSYLNQLVGDTIDEHIDFELWDKRKMEIDDIKERLHDVASNFGKEE
jgi:hypothetical protein